MKSSVTVNGRVYEDEKSICAWLGIGTTTFWRWRRKGELPVALKLGNKFYYNKDEIARRLEQQTTQ